MICVPSKREFHSKHETRRRFVVPSIAMLHITVMAVVCVFNVGSVFASYQNGSGNDSTAESSRNPIVPKCTQIREALRDDFPEIDNLCSDAYLESVANVPRRSIDYAIHKKVKRALEWRRSFRVNSLKSAFVHVRNARACKIGTVGGIFVPVRPRKNFAESEAKSDNTAHCDVDDITRIQENGERTDTDTDFVPSQELIDLCASGAFVLQDEELITMGKHISSPQTKTTTSRKGAKSHLRRIVVYAETSRMNWWQSGVKAGLQYHVLVLEEAFDRIRIQNKKFHSSDALNEEKGGASSLREEKVLATAESIVVFVNTQSAPLLPPPLSVPRGMIELMQTAYPDRIFRIYIGPVNPILRKLFECVKPFLRPRSRKKIVLLDVSPSIHALIQSS